MHSIHIHLVLLCTASVPTHIHTHIVNMYHTHTIYICTRHIHRTHTIYMHTFHIPAHVTYTEHTLHTCYTRFSIIHMHIQHTLCVHAILIHCNPYMRHIFKYHTTHIYIYHLHTTHIYHLHMKTAHTQHTLHIYVTHNKHAHTCKTCTYVQITHTLILP